MSKPIAVAVDFDGTIVKHRFPLVGDPVPYALDVLHAWQEYGMELYLWTMRSHGRPEQPMILTDAIRYCEDNGLRMEGFNSREQDWTRSPKLYANYYVDDAALGSPLVYVDDERPYVDWPLLYAVMNGNLKRLGLPKVPRPEGWGFEVLMDAFRRTMAGAVE
jgi:hypothetical protein